MDQTKENCELIRTVARATGWRAMGSPPMLWAEKRERSYVPIDDDDDLIILAAVAKAKLAKRSGWLFRSSYEYHLDKAWKYAVHGWIPGTNTETKFYTYDPTDPASEAHAILSAIAESIST